MKLIRLAFVITVFPLLLSCIGLFNTTKEKVSAVTWASFSPTGDIVFSYFSKDVRGIFLMRDDGTVIKRILDSKNDGYDFHPVYSSDGSKIAFASNRGGGEGNIYIIDDSGNNLKRLTHEDHFDSYPMFSPDGTKIYFLRSRYFGSYSPIAQPHHQKQDILYVFVNDKSIHAVTDEEFFQLSGPQVFSDSKHIIAQIYKPKMDSIWLIPIDNAKERKAIRPNIIQYLPNLLEKPWATQPIIYDGFYNPVISPDGTWLVFSWADHYKGYWGYELYLMNMNTKKIKKLTDLHSMVEPMSFSKDSQKIRFLTDPKYTPDYHEGDSSLWMYDIRKQTLSNIKVDFSKFDTK